jgi:tetratricopeptide (TPR) repeat protein
MSKAGPLTAYFQASVALLEKEKLEKEIVIETFGKISGIIDYQLSLLKNEKKRSFYISAKENVELLFGPIANCEDLVKLYTSRYEENKENVDWLKRATGLMAKKDCTNDPLFVTMSETLNKLQPSAESAYNIGKMLIDKGQHNKAATYLKEAIDLQEDEEKKAGYYMTLANHTFKNLGQKTQARINAQKAINARPGWGDPYIAIGDYYSASSKECGTNDFEKAAIYWVAVDKYKTAKAMDPSCAETANKKIATFSKYFPNQKDAFFYGFNDGQSYTVGCWINETTKVRVQ